MNFHRQSQLELVVGEDVEDLVVRVKFPKSVPINGQVLLRSLQGRLWQDVSQLIPAM